MTTEQKKFTRQQQQKQNSKSTEGIENHCLPFTIIGDELLPSDCMMFLRCPGNRLTPVLFVCAL
jgi:hypothetical protein